MKGKNDLAQADALMGIFGFSRVSTDRDLLKMAAKAAHHKLRWVEDGWGVDRPRIILTNGLREESLVRWNPLEDDGDALRLAVVLKMEVTFFLGFGEVHCEQVDEPLGHDDYAATRRAIVRAAAAIGESM